MKKKNSLRLSRLLCAVLAAAMLISMIPVGASAVESDGLTIATSEGASDPSNVFIYKKTSSVGSPNEAKLVQYPVRTGYSDYTGSLDIPSRVAENSLGFSTYYTVTEIGGREGEFPGALEGVNLSSVSIPSTVTYIGGYAFANSTIDTLSLSTSVTSAATTAFAGTTTSSVILNVTDETTLHDGAMSYTPAGRSRAVDLPAAVQSLTVGAPLTVTGNVKIPGEVKVNSKLSVSSGSSLTIDGTLSGSTFGNIEVAPQGTLTINSATATFPGYVKLTNGTATLLNNSPVTIRCYNASGGILVVHPGESATGAANGSAIGNDPSEDDTTRPENYPQVSTNYGGTVSVAEDAVTVTITPLQGYVIEEVIINGYSMGTISRYIFEKPSSENSIIVLFAEGDNPEGPDQIITDPILFFTDVSESDPYADAVRFMVQNKLLLGVSATEFAPNAYMTRAMFATVLSRLDTYDARYHLDNGETAFLSDVPNGMWYTGPCKWAAANDIIKPSGTSFRPHSIMSRQELAMYLYNFHLALGNEAYIDPAILESYNDAKTVYPAAYDAVAWAVSMGYLDGRTTSELRPYAGATRAEVAEILMRYLQYN